MLNGIDPLLVIVIKNKGALDFLGNSALVGQIEDLIGLPIPIYLSEKLTGIYVESETRSIDNHTVVDPTTDKDIKTQQVKKPKVTQTSVDTQVTVSLLATTDSILLTAVIALMELIVDRLVSQEYSIHYINGPTVIFGGLLNRFSTSVSTNDNLIRMELAISTATKEQPTPPAPDVFLEKVPGAATP